MISAQNNNEYSLYEYSTSSVAGLMVAYVLPEVASTNYKQGFLQLHLVIPAK